MNKRPTDFDVAEQRRQILALVGRVERRVRLQRAIDRGVAAGLVYLMVMAVVVTLYSTGWIASGTLLSTALILAVFPVSMALWGWFSRVDRVALAQRIDRANRLHDRLSTALSLLETGRDDAFIRAQIRDALAYQDQVDTRLAAPFKRPSDLVPFGIFLAAVALLALFEPPSHMHPLPEAPVIKHDPVLSSSTLEVERDRLEQMRKTLEEINDPELKALVEEMDTLLDEVEARDISEKDFLERIDEIEEKFFDAQKEEATKEIAERLKKAAEALEKEAAAELKKHQEVKEAVDALKEKDLSKAADALNKLAEKLKNNELDEAEAEQLAKLLELFADKIDIEDPELKALAEKHRDLFEKLSKKFDAKGNLSPEEKRQLKREKEKLDELNKRQQEHAKSQATRQLKSLRRATQEMADKLNEKDQGGEGGGQQDGESDGRRGQKDAEKADNDDHKGQKDGEQAQKDAQQGQKDGEKGQKGQQSGQSSSQQQAGRMAEDASRALERGGQQQKSDQVREQAKRQLEEIKETMRRSASRGQNSDSQSDAESAENMRKFLQRASGQDPGDEGEQKNGQKPGKKTASGKAPGKSNQAGQGAGDRELGEQTDMASSPKDTKVDGRDAAGPSKSEIIKAASEKGFATTEYKDVYVDYESVVEEVMDREEVPAGYRYYIKRYFELIKPRE